MFFLLPLEPVEILGLLGWHLLLLLVQSLLLRNVEQTLLVIVCLRFFTVSGIVSYRSSSFGGLAIVAALIALFTRKKSSPSSHFLDEERASQRKASTPFASQELSNDLRTYRSDYKDVLVIWQVIFHLCLKEKVHSIFSFSWWSDHRADKIF